MTILKRDLPRLYKIVQRDEEIANLPKGWTPGKWQGSAFLYGWAEVFQKLRDLEYERVFEVEPRGKVEEYSYLGYWAECCRLRREVMLESFPEPYGLIYKLCGVCHDSYNNLSPFLPVDAKIIKRTKTPEIVLLDYLDGLTEHELNTQDTIIFNNWLHNNFAFSLGHPAFSIAMYQMFARRYFNTCNRTCLGSDRKYLTLLQTLKFLDHNPDHTLVGANAQGQLLLKEE
jgi:hypothetical protein